MKGRLSTCQTGDGRKVEYLSDRRWKECWVLVRQEMEGRLSTCQTGDGRNVEYLSDRRWKEGWVFVRHEMEGRLSTCQTGDGRKVEYLSDRRWKHTYLTMELTKKECKFNSKNPQRNTFCIINSHHSTKMWMELTLLFLYVINKSGQCVAFTNDSDPGHSFHILLTIKHNFWLLTWPALPLILNQCVKHF